MTVASSSAEVEANDGPFIRNFGTPRIASLPDEDRDLPQPRLGQEAFEQDDVAEDVGREDGGDPASGHVHRMRADDPSVHHQRIDRSVDIRQASTDRIWVSDVHKDDTDGRN